MYIPENILMEVEGHDNVMLLAMSTLPCQPKVNTYQAHEGKETWYFKSLSQMEPHTKYVIRKLAAEKEKLDRIVILESSKVRAQRPKNWNQETATSLFTKRIINYVGGSEQIDIEEPDERKDLVEAAVEPQLYQNGFPEIITVDMEDSVFFWKAVQKIVGPNRNRRICLYMDMQGGDRNAVAQMNATVKLLERQKVDIKGRYANNFEPKSTGPHVIRDASKEYRTYELISAMDIFIQYGWGDKLDQYFRGITKRNSKERRLIDAINKASSAISRCNSDGFDSAVRKIEQLKLEFKKPEKITEMDVVYQDIYEDYAPLFSAKYRYVEQIRWCLNKNFIQQALTILEAKMPSEFIHSGLLYYMSEKGNKKDFLIKCENLYNKNKKDEKYRMKDLNHYLVKEYFEEKNVKDIQFFFGLEKSSEKVTTLIRKYKKLSDLRNQVNHAAVGKHNPDGFFVYMQEKYKDDKNWKSRKETNYKEEILNFLKDWEELADQVPEELRKQVIDLS